ncbi:MAG TPA: hypothetical protein VF538_05250 [Pyrinomonadaceae bacterium]|jgi:hypothetical protein
MATDLRENAMSKYAWSRLNKLQVGRYSEYFAKMEFTLYGFDVYQAEVDDKGIDFVIRKGSARYYDVQVKSSRGFNYIYFNKNYFELRDNLYATIVLFEEGKLPDLFLIPATAWLCLNSLFVSRDYPPPRKSKPDWGLCLSSKNYPLLQDYAFEKVVSLL